jgi:copper chaperone CopZ
MKKVLSVVLVIIVIVLLVTLLFRDNKNMQQGGTTPDSLKVVQVEVSVSGMFCNGCAQSIQQKISSLEGVQSAVASFPDSNVIVSFDTTKANNDSLIQAIEAKGYGVKEIKRKI